MTTDANLKQSAPPAIDAYVLVVDDDQANRESLSRRLQRRGMRVDVAADGSEALNLIAANTYDLVMLDVMMPGLSGIEVLQRVRQTRTQNELPIIMATANDKSADVAEALSMGANDYITKPIDFTVALARVVTQLAMGRAARMVLDLQQDLRARNAELKSMVLELKRNADRARVDMELAARVQATFLPRGLPEDSRYRVAWRYLPCDQLAGDGLNVCPLGPDHVAFYVLDVSGHGVASSLTAVTAARMLAPAHDPASILVSAAGPLSPAKVLDELSNRFVFDGETGTGQFITCFYAVLELSSGQLHYASAGHPEAIFVPGAGPPRVLSGNGTIIGLGATYQQQSMKLLPGDRVVIYSDGVTETMRPDRTQFGPESLLVALAESRTLSLDAAADTLLADLTTWRGSPEPADDVSILAFEWTGEVKGDISRPSAE